MYSHMHRFTHIRIHVLIYAYMCALSMCPLSMCSLSMCPLSMCPLSMRPLSMRPLSMCYTKKYMDMRNMAQPDR